MRRLGSLLPLVMLSCAGNPPPAPEAAVAPGAVPTLEKAPDSGQVDRVGASDGALGPDGTNDLGFVTTFEGAVAAIFLVGVDDNGAPLGSFQADTLTGEVESPQELGARPGHGTSGLGVLEGGQILNAKDGSLPIQAAGAHRFTLYLAPSPAVTPGTKLRVYLQRPDSSLVAGAVVTN